MTFEKRPPEDLQKEMNELPSLKCDGSEAAETDVLSGSDTGDLPALVESPEFKPGSVFQGKYEILGKIGAGGMGQVYKARDLTLNRTVAIKFLAQPAVANEKVALRFQQEARAAGSLTHGGIVAVHEFGLSSEGQLFLVMDFVDGVPLSAVIAQSGKLPVDWSMDITLKVADALAYAHERGVVHRDLKPANIMLVNNGRDVKIVDFGIAKIMTDEGSALTQTGEVFGTPFYMSPEQCAGTKVDHRTDIYSLACVLYETLVGQPPHKGDSALATALMHLKEEPLPVLAVRPGLQCPEALQVVLDKAMAKDVSARYNSISEFRSDLEQLLRSNHDALIAKSAVSQQQRIINAIKQRLQILLSLILLVSAAFVNNLALSGLLYLAGGLLFIFSIPGLGSDKPVAAVLQAQSRTSIPISRQEMLAWIIFGTFLLGLISLYWHH